MSGVVKGRPGGAEGDEEADEDGRESSRRTDPASGVKGRVAEDSVTEEDPNDESEGYLNMWPRGDLRIGDGPEMDRASIGRR